MASKTGAAIPFARVQATAAARKDYSPRVLPDVKPAVSAYNVLASADEVWVPHDRGAGATTKPHDLLNARGARIATVEVPKNKTLPAVTRTSVYFTRADDDGLQWIEAYAR